MHKVSVMRGCRRLPYVGHTLAIRKTDVFFRVEQLCKEAVREITHPTLYATSRASN